MTPIEDTKRGELAHYPPCGPGSKNLFGKRLFWSTKSGIDEGQYVEVSNKNSTFAVFFAKSIHVFLDMIKLRVTPLPT